MDKKYIRRQFEQINKESNLNGNTSYEFFQYQPMISTSKDAEVYLTRNNKGFKNIVIHFMFRNKERLKKIPIIGAILVNKKNSMIKNSTNKSGNGKVLQLDSILGLYCDDFIVEAYKAILNRVPDELGYAEFKRHAYLGASNGAIAYLLISSPEFDHRFEVTNLKQYKKEFDNYKRKATIYRIPLIGRLFKLAMIPTQMNLLRNHMEHCHNKLNELLLINAAKNIEKDNLELKYLTSIDQSIKQHDNYLESMMQNMKGLDDRIEQVTVLNTQVTESLKIETAISEKIDLLPTFIAQNNTKNKSVISSLPGGVLAVQAGDFIMGIPSEEWGLAMFLSLNGHFEPGSEKVFCSLIKEGMTFVDVGANLGIYTLHALHAGCKVHSYEPTPSTFHLLNQNIKANGFLESQKSLTYNVAVGDREKTTTFSICKGISGHNHISTGEETEDIIKVPVVALDNHLKDTKVDFIKIDVEGAEYDAFLGMKNIIANNPEVLILMEFAPSHLKRAGVNPLDLLNLIREYGLSIQTIDENLGQVGSAPDDELINEISVNLLLSRQMVRSI